MPSIPIQPLRTYRATFTFDMENLFREYARMDAQLETHLSGTQWEREDDRPLTLSEAGIAGAEVADGYELYKGKLIKKEGVPE